MANTFLHLITRTTPYWPRQADDGAYRGSFVEVDEHRTLGAHIIDVWKTEDDRLLLRYGKDNVFDCALPVIEKLIAAGSTARSIPAWKFALELMRTSKIVTGERHNGEPPLSHADAEPFVIDRFQSWYDVDGASKRSVWFISWPSAALQRWAGDWDEQRKLHYVKHIAFPATHCTHSHDCCGHWYSSAAKITKLPSGRWLISQRSSMNV